MVPQTALCTIDPLPSAMNPVRQQWLTTLAVYSFFESKFALSELRRQEAAEFLLNTMSTEIPQVTVTRAAK